MRWGSSNQSRERNRGLSAAMVVLLLVSPRYRGARCRGLSEGLYLGRQDGELGHVGAGREGREEEARGGDVLWLEAAVPYLSRWPPGDLKQDRGVNDAWQHSREAYTPLVLLEAGRVGQLGHPRLRRLVGRAGHVRPRPGDAADEDDEPARGAQVRERGPYRVERAAQVHRDHGVPALPRELLEPPLWEVHPGGHYENVDPIRLAYLLDEPPDCLFVRDVEWMSNHVPSPRALLYGLLTPRCGVRPGARLGEEVGGGEADPAARPDHERRPPRERAVLHDYRSVSARKILICSDGPFTSSAKAPGPSSSGNTGGRSPIPALPATSHSSACS